MFTEDTCIARASNNIKKQAKLDTYVAALDALLNKPVEKLIIPVKEEEHDEDDAVEIEAIVSGTSQPKIVSSSGTSLPKVVISHRCHSVRYQSTKSRKLS